MTFPTATAQELIDDIKSVYNGLLGEGLVFVTITLKPKLYKYQSLTQFELTHLDIESCLYRHSTAYMSVELTSDGNVHYHAICHFGTKLQRIHMMNMFKKNRQIGFVKITPNPIESLESLTRSAHYLVKSISDTSKVLHSSNYKPDICKLIVLE